MNPLLITGLETSIDAGGQTSHDHVTNMTNWKILS